MYTIQSNHLFDREELIQAVLRVSSYITRLFGSFGAGAGVQRILKARHKINAFSQFRRN